MLAKLCGIQDNLFAIEDIVMPELTEKNKQLIESIKKLYAKRDKIKSDDYEVDAIRQLYKFMLDSLTKKLKLFSSCRSKKAVNRDKVSYLSNEEMFTKYDNLIQTMNPQTNAIYLMEEDEEYEE